METQIQSRDLSLDQRVSNEIKSYIFTPTISHTFEDQETEHCKVPLLPPFKWENMARINLYIFLFLNYISCDSDGLLLLLSPPQTKRGGGGGKRELFFCPRKTTTTTSASSSHTAP